MNLDELNHELTPDALSVINSQIIQFLQQPDEESSGFESFYQLISQRDEFVQRFLKDAAPADARAFAEKELVVNDKLTALAQDLLKSAKDDASRFIRSQAAIKKYK
ncbi:hypothetical protein [Alteromonas lipolytica]|uniref:Uncharacterized protein n=1 Tax=Alteromonas lipolytica TaxID=1856405 RepID=A0A1E8FF65_9ALTE|nr:hypothetical protein [Alteromonas lipolytica]OFI34575.1 hypothetical protein BFC17_13325 [Alteromonas lipolytica]GGF52199.1 hypothetical protein GCM10011338_00390 [Alteromonas lipolytica]